MKSISNKVGLINQKLKTLCTLDSSDIILTSDAKQIMQKKKNKQNLTKTRKPSLLRGKSQELTTHNIIQREAACVRVIHRQNRRRSNIQKRLPSTSTSKTPKTDKKPKKPQLKSIPRTKTQPNQDSPKRIVLKNLQILTVVKNIKFHIDQQYNVDSFYLMETIKSSQEQTISTVKYLGRNGRERLFVLRQSNYPKIVQTYHQQITLKHDLTDSLAPSQKASLSCIHKVYRPDNHHHMQLLYQMQGRPLSWKNQTHRRLIHNLTKNNMEIMRHLVVELSKAIHTLSRGGYYHAEVRLKNVLVDVREDRDSVKVGKQVKLGGLHKCCRIKDKHKFQTMQDSVYTPPEILNFAMFQRQDKHFNRAWLDFIYQYQDAWRVNIWSLGILILELLNQQPLQCKFLQTYEIVQYQKEILKKSIFLTDKITDPELHKLLNKMLSPNPYQRPSPQQIIISLTA